MLARDWSTAAPFCGKTQHRIDTERPFSTAMNEWEGEELVPCLCLCLTIAIPLLTFALCQSPARLPAGPSPPLQVGDVVCVSEKIFINEITECLSRRTFIKSEKKGDLW